MEKKVLYYFGAGASANSLPLARSVFEENNEYSPKLQGLAYALKHFDFDSIRGAMDPKFTPYIEDMRFRFRQLSESAEKFGDVDTYAKYLHLMNPGGKELNEIKSVLFEFFSLTQLMMNKNDSRYLPGLVSIMKRKRFPENVKILSWNYDYQVELAYSSFEGLEEVKHQDGGFSYSGTSLLSYPSLDPTFSEYNSLSLIHLNGIAGFIRPSFLNTASIFQKDTIHHPKEFWNFLKRIKKTLL